MIFLIVALVVFATFETVVNNSLNAEKTGQTVQQQQGQKDQEVLSVSIGSVPDELTVQNTGSVESVVVTVFGIDSAGYINTTSITAVSIPPLGEAQVPYQPDLCEGGCFKTGVITSLGNVFYAHPANAVGGSLTLSGFKFYDACTSSSCDTVADQIGDGYPLQGFTPTVSSGSGTSAYFGIPSGKSIMFSLNVTDVDSEGRNITLSDYSTLSFSGSSNDWYIVGAVVVGDGSCTPEYTCGAEYTYYTPVTVSYGQTATLYFAAPAPCSKVSSADDPCSATHYSGYPDATPTAPSTMNLVLSGTYSDGSVYTGTDSLGLAYFSSESVTTAASPCGGYREAACSYQLLSGAPGTVFDLYGCTSNSTATCFTTAPVVLWTDKDGTTSVKGSGSDCVATVTDCITFSIPRDASACSFSIPGDCYQIAVTDQVLSYVYGEVQVTAPTISLKPQSGPNGTVVTVTGTGFAANFPNQVEISSPLAPSENVSTTTGSFSVTFTVGTVSLGQYTVKAVDEYGNTATQTFTASLATLSLSPGSGPAGTVVSLAGTGYQSGTSYTACLSTSATNFGTCLSKSNSFSGDDQQIPSGITIQVPSSTTAGSYYVIVYSGSQLLSSARFQVTTPTLDVSPASGPYQTSVSLAGSGYAPSLGYSYCLGTSLSTTSCIAGSTGTLTTDSSGSLPSGASFDVPATPATTPTSPDYVLIYQTGFSTVTLSYKFTVVPVLYLNGNTHIRGPVGSVVAVTGWGFAPNLPATGVTITFPKTTASEGGEVQCGTNGAGTLDSCSLDIAAASAGSYTVTAKDTSSNTASATFTVTPSVTLPPAPQTTGKALQVTGAGFGDEQLVSISFGGAPAVGAVQTTTPSQCYTTSYGAFSCSFVPYSPAGSYYVTATDAESHTSNASSTLQPSISLVPTTQEVGQSVSIEGSGFENLSTTQVTVWLWSPLDPSATTKVGTCSTNAVGNLTSCSFDIPTGTETGVQTVGASDGTNSATAPLSVTRTFTYVSTSTLTSTSVTTYSTTTITSSPVTTLKTTSTSTSPTQTLYTTSTTSTPTATEYTTSTSYVATTTLYTTSTSLVPSTTLFTTSTTLLTSLHTTSTSLIPTTTVYTTYTTSTPTKTTTSRIDEFSSTTITLYTTFTTSSVSTTLYSTSSTVITTLESTSTSTIPTATVYSTTTSLVPTTTLYTTSVSTVATTTRYTTTLSTIPTTTRYTTTLSTVPTTTVFSSSTVSSTITSTTTLTNTQTFTVTTTVTARPSLSISPAAGSATTEVTLEPSSSGYAPNAQYYYCYETGSAPYAACPTTYGFTSTSAGTIPTGKTLTLDATAYGAVVVSDSSDTVASYATFTLQPFLDPNTNSHAVAGAASSSSTELTGGNAIDTTDPYDVVYACADTHTTGVTFSLPSDTAGLKWATAPGASDTSGTELQCWYAVAASPLSDDSITFSLSNAGSSGGWVVYAFAVSGTNTTSASTIFDGSAATAGSATGSPTVSFTTSQAGDLLVGIAATNGRATMTAGSGFTLIDASVSQTSNSGAYESQTATTAKSYTVNFGSSTGTWVIAAVAFAPG